MTFAVYPTVANEVVRYLEDGTFNEALGAGPVFTVLAGTERWTDLLPGVQGFALDEATRIGGTTYAPLQLTGEMTVECIFRAFERTANSDQWTLLTHESSTEAEGANILYSLKVFQNFTGTNGAPVLTPGWRSEHGAGVDDILTAPSFVLEPGGLYHYAARRHPASGGTNLIDLFLNAQLAASGLLTTPTGGTTSTFLRVGNNSSAEAASFASGAIGFIRICSRALTDAEIEAAYDATLGGVLGARRVAP